MILVAIRRKIADAFAASLAFYAAPEMIKGVRYVGPEVDIWSLGVILFALLSGRLPFDASTMSELYERISKGHYVAPNHFSERSYLILFMRWTLLLTQSISRQEFDPTDAPSRPSQASDAGRSHGAPMGQ